jgi:ribosome biogenesis protein Nip4
MNKIFEFDQCEELFKMEEKQAPFSKTLINSKEQESKEMNNIKEEKKNKNTIDKKYVESIQIKVREHILSKRPFKEKKKIGRKKKEFEGLGQHNKFSDDNIINKIKHAIIQNVRIFINQKIKNIYAYEDAKTLKKKILFKLKQNQPESSKSAYDKDFLLKTLGEIFSQEISSKYTLHPSSHNKKLIKLLMDDKEERNKLIFCRIFNLTFVECLEHFRGSKKIEVLEGINNLEDYIKERNIDEDKEYCNLFKYFANNLEKIIMEKKPRIKVQK